MPTQQNTGVLEELFPRPDGEVDIEARVEARIASLQETEQKRLARLEEKLNTVQRHNIYSFEDYDVQVPQISIPHKFKLPDFEKFKGVGCPKMHLKYFLHEMLIYPKDDLSQVTLFQESLTGSTLHWYLSLDTSMYASFRELAQDFLNHYSFNIEMAPTISDLRKLEKYHNESIKDFARRIRGVGHDTRNCFALRFKIQSLLDDKIIAFETLANPPNIQQNSLPEHVNMIVTDTFEAELPPLFTAIVPDWPIHEAVIFVLHSMQPGDRNGKPAVYTPLVTSTFLYQSSATVRPFIYKPQVNALTNSVTSISGENEKETNIITRSGRVIPATETLKSTEAPKIGEVLLEEAKNVKYIRTSECDIVEQLRKQQAQISLFDLINSSDKHRDVLQQFLAEVHVPA
ncbi:hypothetical protein MLD38_006332 [Melastoma candidum]|uniref:Uncharacterized protein n=1 Tax=Melastoma candidum TaxID=119954 RepID=A0ACB9RNT6_9MYRT|nr:hypothetical protein MLD38_006332 [Melastoma candidum]